MHSFKTIFFSALFFSICCSGADISQAQDPFELTSSFEVNFDQWRKKYHDFIENNEGLLNKDKWHEFLYPLVQELHCAYAKGKICDKKMAFEFNFYEPRDSTNGLKWKKVGHDIITFDPAEKDQITYKTFGRHTFNEIHFESPLKGISRLHLICIPAGDELLTFDLFSNCGTDILDSNMSVRGLLLLQQAAHNHISHFFVGLEPVNLRVAAAKLEIIPLNR